MTYPVPLADRHCFGYDKKSKALTAEEIAQLHPQVEDWEIIEVDGIAHLQRTFTFKDFVRALAFTNAVADRAEAEDHHPALLTEWGKVQVQWWTHYVGGLHLNDFIAAAITDRLYAE